MLFRRVYIGCFLVALAKSPRCIGRIPISSAREIVKNMVYGLERAWEHMETLSYDVYDVLKLCSIAKEAPKCPYAAAC